MVQVVIVGKFGAVHGVRGWIKVHSFTNPKKNILEFGAWLLPKNNSWVAVELEDYRCANDNILVKLHGCDTPEAARLYTNEYIAVERAQLPALPEGEYYWADLIGLNVSNQNAVNLGVVEKLITTGANDVLVVLGERKRLIPYISQVIQKVDLQQNLLIVDWDETF